MGWFFSLAFMIVGFVLNDSSYIIAAGLFAIAGSIAVNGSEIKQIAVKAEAEAKNEEN